MELKSVAIPLLADMELIKGIMVSAEDVMNIHQGISPSNWEELCVYKYTESRFIYDKWDFLNPSFPRHLQLQSSSRKINWKAHALPESMLEELKRITWARIVTHSSVPHSLSCAKRTLKFLSEMVSYLHGRGLMISSLSEFKSDDIEAALGCTEQSRLNLRRNVRPFLLFMAEASVGKYVGLAVKWSRADIEAMPWERCNQEKQTFGSREPLSGELFIYRSNLNRALVRDYLEALGKCPEDTDKNTIYEEMKSKGELLTQRCPDHVAFTALIQAYRNTSGFYSKKNNKKKNAFCTARDAFEDLVKTLPDWVKKMSRHQVMSLIVQARFAAMQIVGIYTGMRESELKGIRQPLGATAEERCVRCDNGMWFLYSTVVKDAIDGAPVGTHRWVAPTVIRDAIMVLELQQPLNANQYLISGLGGKANFDRPYNSPSTRIRTSVLGPHFKGTEWEGDIARWTHHTDRHTLVKELEAAGVQLVHISRQLHHTHMMLAESEGSEITELYGGIGEAPLYKKQTQTNSGLMTAIDEYREKKKRERYHAVLGEGAILAGSGGEKLKVKIEAKFQGLGFAGEDRKEYIDMLVDSGFPLPTSGFGVCGQEVFNMEDEPPCMGDYECDPNCKSCIITPERTYQAINEFHRAISMQSCDEQEHNWPYWEHREKVFNDILVKLGKNSSEIKKIYLENVSEVGQWTMN